MSLGGQLAEGCLAGRNGRDVAVVGGEDDNWSQVTFKSSIEISETFNIKHMDLIDEENTWYKLGDTVVNVLVNNFVDFQSQLLGDFGLLWSVDLAHQGKEVMTSLWSSICHIKIVQCHILYNLLLLVNITLWNWHVFFGLEIVLGGV